MDRSESGPLTSVNKITWQKAGSVTEPGRYRLTFVTITYKAYIIVAFEREQDRCARQSGVKME